MTLNTKIKKLREAKGLTQEQMADEICVSKSTYGRIERGETALTEQKLERLATAFNIDDWAQIKSCPEDKIIFLLAENNTIENGNLEQAENLHVNYYGNEFAQAENEKLQLIIAHKDEIITQLKNENDLLKQMLDLLKSNQPQNNK